MRATIGLESTVIRNTELPTTAVDDDLVVLNLAQSEYVGLDAIGRGIWELIGEPVEVAAVCDAIARRYRGAASEIRADVVGFLEQLSREGLVHVVAR